MAIAPRQLAIPTALTLALALVLTPAKAAAHGHLPEGAQIVFDPTDPSAIYATTSFGLIVSRDDGATWRWICFQAFLSKPPIELEEAVIGILPDGTLLTAYEELFRGTSHGCSWSDADARLLDVTDFEVLPSGDILALQAELGEPSQIFVGTAGGTSWAPRGSPLASEHLVSIAAAPSDSSVVYAASTLAPPAHGAVFYSSDDGGTTLLAHPIELGPSELSAYVAGVDPLSSARVFVHTWSPADADRLLVSDDGGGTWAQIFTADEILAFVMSADGARAWIAAGVAGVWRSTDGGRTFLEVGTVRARGLALRGDELWVWANQSVDGFTIGRSMDGGDTFEMLFSYPDLAGVAECEETDAVTAICPMHWPDVAFELGIDAGPRDAGAGLDASPALPDADVDGARAPDAGATSPPSGESDGCACKIASPRRRAGGSATAALAAVALLAITSSRRTYRRRARRRP